MDVMSKKAKTDKQKPGPDPERLIITEDPETALSKLLTTPIKPAKTDT